MRIATMKTILEFLDYSKCDGMDIKLWKLKRSKIIFELNTEIQRGRLNYRYASRKMTLKENSNAK